MAVAMIIITAGGHQSSFVLADVTAGNYYCAFISVPIANQLQSSMRTSTLKLKFVKYEIIIKCNKCYKMNISPAKDGIPALIETGIS